MRKRFIAVGVASTALLTTLATSSPAQAAIGYASCSTTGASGNLAVPNYDGATTKISLTLAVTDTRKDDYHVRVRLLTKNHAGQVTYWKWRANRNGVGKTMSWDTTAENSSGIHDVGVRIARFDGDKRLNRCTDWD